MNFKLERTLESDWCLAAVAQRFPKSCCARRHLFLNLDRRTGDIIECVDRADGYSLSVSVLETRTTLDSGFVSRAGTTSRV